MLQDLEQLKIQLADFAKRRAWEKYHSPKNLSMALIAESAELIEHFQWLTENESRTIEDKKLEEVRMELADIFIYLIRIADVLKIDLAQAARDKIEINETRFPTPTPSQAK